MMNMRRITCRLVALMLVAGLAHPDWTAADPEVPPRPAVRDHEIQRGMTAAEVRKLLGPPRRTARQILYRRYLEQWTYDAPTPLLIELECVKGQDPHVLMIHKLPEVRP